ncbi:MAG TPA: tetratricopeptide repeat protein [Candidatus Gastranaerophilaceae bacterium]|nr:tetratricopeptide repeat protein [Candidatus Gastranaerophilaceae bacterium]HPT41444.1 tetratricopeptide repeat protein [Candidatus Gastranaerophilaceae bacterium]
MKKAFLLVTILFVSVISTACINNLAVQELNNKAKSYLDKGDYENAISRLKSSLDLDSSFFETHYNLGIAYTQAEKYPEAVETFESAIKIKPDFADTYYSLAVAQENYAKGIIDGTIKDEDKDEDKEQEDKIDAEEETHQNKNLSAQEKTKVCELLDKAVQSYQTYLEKGLEIKDKEEVEEKIEYLKIQIEKYSSQPPLKEG